MNRDAHFHAILAFCRACGFNKNSAHIVAYASQFVDDARINLMFIRNRSDDFVHDFVDNRPAFFNMATCHSYLRIKAFNYEAMVNQTSPFHFVPGCCGENFTKKLRCKEESPVIMDIFSDVLLEGDLIKLGIVLHAYADTFSHQGFSGVLSKVNDIKNCQAISEAYLGLVDKTLYKIKQHIPNQYDGLFDRVIPAYGHGQALDFPDLPYLVWSYDYDYSDEFNGSYQTVEIDNKDRYQRAFKKVKKHLENYLHKHPQFVDRSLRFADFNALLEALVLQTTDYAREENWKRVLVKHGLFNPQDLDLITYRDNKWLREAFVNFDPIVFDNGKIQEVHLADSFNNSNWYHFYLSVKWYKKKVFEYCSKYGLNIPV